MPELYVRFRAKEVLSAQAIYAATMPPAPEDEPAPSVQGAASGKTPNVPPPIPAPDEDEDVDVRVLPVRWRGTVRRRGFEEACDRMSFHDFGDFELEGEASMEC